MIRKTTLCVLTFLAFATFVLNVVSCYPLPYYTKVLPAPRGTPAGWVRPLEVSLYDGCVWIHSYTYSGLGRAPENGFRRYQFVSATQPCDAAWAQNFEDILGDVAAGFGTLWRIPLLLPFAVFAAYPACTLWRYVRRHEFWQKKGLCANCGYNLTGNVSGVCPECGTPVPDARTPKASG